MNQELKDWVNGIVKENYTMKEWQAYQDGYNQSSNDADLHYKNYIEQLENKIAELKKENLNLIRSLNAKK